MSGTKILALVFPAAKDDFGLSNMLARLPEYRASLHI
jgi:hypothetical protein